MDSAWEQLIVFFLAATVAMKPSKNAVETTLAATTTRTAPATWPLPSVGLAFSESSVSLSAAPIVL